MIEKVHSNYISCMVGVCWSKAHQA